jgi:hypothetical protein
MPAGIETLRCPRWGTDRRDEAIEQPSWSDVERAIHRLNGADYNDLYLERPDDSTWMAIGGGDGRYFVMLTTAAQTGEESWSVACLDATEEGTESLVVGGQPGDYPARQIVAIVTALDAARGYFATGALSPTLHWEHN